MLQWKNILFLVTASYTLATSKDILSVCSFYKAVMKTIHLQLTELEDDFFLLSEGSNEEVREGDSETHRSQTNSRNFVIKCLEVGNSKSFI